MNGKLPTSLAVLSVLFGTSVLVFSIYLERTQLEFLQAHPILVNLLSSMIGFGFAIVVVAVGINRFIRRARVKAILPRLHASYNRVRIAHQKLPYTIPVDILARLDRVFFPQHGQLLRRVREQLDGKSPDAKRIVDGTSGFLGTANRFLDLSTKLIELLEAVDEDLVNRLSFVGEELERLEAINRKAVAREGDVDQVRLYVTHYSLTLSSIGKLWSAIQNDPGVRRMRKPKRF